MSSKKSPPKLAYHKHGVMMAEIAIGLVVIGLIAGGILTGREIATMSQVHAQIAQITRFDEAVSNFYEKFDALPGDILSASAEREGLPSGDGTPAHSDGDGKISPCNTGWQWHLGCETALFWAQLSAEDFIKDNFTADSRLEDERLQEVGVMDPYLPKSPLDDNIYITVWNSSADQPSPEPRLLYGNYYEITKIHGVEGGKLKDDINALTPAQAYAIDKKMDDGYPLSGRVVVNGSANWPQDAWGTFATPGENSCVSPNRHYNIQKLLDGHQQLCHVAIALDCCDKNE